jgi:N-acetylglutamate synthase-like GNAT family acetyltransferase
MNTTKIMFILILSFISLCNTIYAMETETRTTTPEFAKNYIKETTERFIFQFYDQVARIKCKQCDYWYSSRKDSLLNVVTSFTPTDQLSALIIINNVIHCAKIKQLPLSWPILDDCYKDTVKIFLEKQKLSQSKIDFMEFDCKKMSCSFFPPYIKLLDTYEISDWMGVFNDAFGEEDPQFTRSYMHVIEKDIEDLLCKKHSVEHYAGYLNGKLVTTGTLCITKDCGEISNIATHEKAPKGMSTRMVTYLLLRGKQLELNKLFLLIEAESIAQKMYEKLGFTKVITFDSYYLPAEHLIIP